MASRNSAIQAAVTISSKRMSPGASSGLRFSRSGLVSGVVKDLWTPRTPWLGLTLEQRETQDREVLLREAARLGIDLEPLYALLLASGDTMLFHTDSMPTELIETHVAELSQRLQIFSYYEGHRSTWK